jgi:hypothetical protein
MLLDKFNFIYIIDNLGLNKDIYKKLDKKNYLKLNNKSYDVSVNSKVVSKIPRANPIRKKEEDLRNILLFLDIFLNAKKNNYEKIIIINNDFFIPEFIFDSLKTPDDWNFLFLNKNSDTDKEVELLAGYNSLDMVAFNKAIYDDMIKYLNTFKDSILIITNEVITKNKKAFLLTNLFSNLDIKNINHLKKILGSSELKICFGLNNDLNYSILDNMSIKKDDSILSWNFNEEVLLKRLFNCFFKNNKIVDADSAYLPYIQYLKRNFKNIKFFSIKDTNENILNYLNRLDTYDDRFPSFLKKEEEPFERYISLYKDMENILIYKNINFEVITFENWNKIL